MKKYICILIISISWLSSYPQASQYSNFAIKAESPTAYQFTKYDQMPVSEYTGVPSINIPLYELLVDGIKIPLGLNYHTGGIKVDQESSWVGLGWDMTIGSITQQINEDDDLYPYFNSATTKFRPDYFPSYYYNVEFFPWKNDDYISNSTPGIATLPIYPTEMRYGYRVATNYFMPESGKYISKASIFDESYKYVDSEPDIFIANFLGEKLHFIMEFNKNPTKAIVLNKKNYKIEIEYKANQNTSWIITNPDGIQFFFDERIETIGSSYGDGRYPSYGSSDTRRTRNTWMLTKIITRNQRTISFQYEKTASVLRKTIYSHLGEEKVTPSTYQDINVPTDQLPYVVLNQSPKQLLINRSTSKEAYCYLKSINFPFGSIDFFLSNREDVSESKKLDQVVVLNGQRDTIRNVHLQYDYFTETDNKSKRLKLQNIIIDKHQKYSFTYNSMPLPVEGTYAQDYWGYYNGSTNNKSLLPNPSQLRFSEAKHIDTGNNKSANLTYTKAGILETIHYPTGGSVSFDYESNEFEAIGGYWIPDFNSTTNVVSKGYGLRIKDIIHKDTNGETIKRISYQYKGGKALIPLNPIRFVSYKWVSSSMLLRVYNERIAILSTSGISQGNPFSANTGIGYDTVISIQKGKDLAINGKVVSTYWNNYETTNNIEDPYGHGYFVTYLPSIKKADYPENGLLKHKIIYNDKNELIQETKYTYTNSLSELHYGVKITGFSPLIKIPNYNGNINFSTYTRHLFAYYPIFDFETLLNEEEIIEYSESGNIKTLRTHTYDSKNRLSSTQINTSKDNTLQKIEYIYSPESGSIADILLSKNRYNEIISINKYMNNNQISYQNFSFSTIKGILGDNIPIIKQADNGNNKTTFESSFYTYNQFGLIEEILDKNNLPISYLWGYGGQYPVTEIKGISVEDVKKITASIDLLNVDKAKLDKLREQFPNALITTYKYKPLVGMTEMTDPRGVTTYYEYDSFGRLYRTLDANKKVIQTYDYHYQNQ